MNLFFLNVLCFIRSLWITIRLIWKWDEILSGELILYARGGARKNWGVWINFWNSGVWRGVKLNSFDLGWIFGMGVIIKSVTMLPQWTFLWTKCNKIYQLLQENLNLISLCLDHHSFFFLFVVDIFTKHNTIKSIPRFQKPWLSSLFIRFSDNIKNQTLNTHSPSFAVATETRIFIYLSFKGEQWKWKYINIRKCSSLTRLWIAHARGEYLPRNHRGNGLKFWKFLLSNESPWLCIRNQFREKIVFYNPPTVNKGINSEEVVQ